MRKCPPNPRLICPECGKRKHSDARKCWACAHPECPNPKVRVRQVVVAVAKGQCFKEIASDWHRSVKTVEYFWAQAKAKHGFQSPVDAALYAVRNRLVSL